MSPPHPPCHPRIAFVDIETTGLGHGRHRIAEIGVVTLDENGIEEWSALLDPGRRVIDDGEFGRDASFTAHASGTGLPRFADIAQDLSNRLKDRLFVAHNARFDHAFVAAEYARCGIDFSSPALCTVMLSRKLYPKETSHHLDALIERHDLDRDERHRALPDARALLNFWRVVTSEIPRRKLDAAIASLLVEPLLPEHLDLGMIDGLPERPGVFVLEDESGGALHIGRASNLRRHVKGYFRIERQCARADEFAYRVSNIRADVADGPIDARLIEIARRKALAMRSAISRRARITIRIDASAPVIAELVALSEPDRDGDLFGLFATEKKARNALKRIATKLRVCPRLIGVDTSKSGGGCNCGSEKGVAGCARNRQQHLVRFLTAIAPLRLASWPYRGPIAIREGRKVHVFDAWQHLGSVRAGSDIVALLDQRRGGFDADVFTTLQQMLPRVAAKSLRVLKTKSAVSREENAYAE